MRYFVALLLLASCALVGCDSGRDRDGCRCRDGRCYPDRSGALPTGAVVGADQAR